MSALRRVSTAMSAQCATVAAARRASTIRSATQVTSSGQDVNVADATWPGAVPGGRLQQPEAAARSSARRRVPAVACAARSGRLSTFATSRIVGPLRRLTVSA